MPDTRLTKQAFLQNVYMVNMVDEESGIYCGLGGPAKCLPLFPAGAAAAANKHQQM